MQENILPQKRQYKKSVSSRNILVSMFSLVANKLLKNPYVLIAPAIILVSLFSLYPALFALKVSFLKWDVVTGEKSFVGFDNYVSVFTDPEWLQVMKNTFLYTVFTVIFGLIFALLIGILLKNSSVLNNFVQSVIFTPQIVSFVSVSIMWMWLFDPQMGMINYALKFIGLKPQLWMLSPKTSLLSVIIVSIWKGLGFNAMIVIAGLQSIPVYIYEAAKLDRSSRLSTLFRITIPLLSPTLFFLLITSTIGAFTSFDVVNLMTKGGPQGSSNVLVHWIYQVGFLKFQLGRAMAASILFLIMIGIISIINFKFFSRKVHYQ
ncbi:carbohydrate ABC transporter permease [Paenibacillus sp. OV219]|uniref:carbohydrate ABC transporter permease n=1 Tax=Paenibacillus sp. OV219 TaxID=1884377 RepID=UPI0008AEA27C|nr:sugar ABC transporter permease [Paenibacillus sp. OV219]SEO52178.1 carbohydrate ABC transporter membrane protein 1, CUT1 family [Paenibacillus sp. OV219]